MRWSYANFCCFAVCRRLVNFLLACLLLRALNYYYYSRLYLTLSTWISYCGDVVFINGLFIYPLLYLYRN